MRALLPFFALALMTGCSRNADLPVYGHVSPFVLTSQAGEEFSSERALKGRVWVADFTFTTCPGPGPLMAKQMRRLEDFTRDLPDVRMVSFTVDPEYDTPAVLADYARKFDADTTRWALLTGSMATLNRLGWDDFKVHQVDGSRRHSIRFILVDRHGDIRGYYDAREEAEFSQLVTDLRRLAQ